MIISCKLATTEYGAETFFQSQLVNIKLYLAFTDFLKVLEERANKRKSESSKHVTERI